MSRKLRWLIFGGILFSFFCGMVADKVMTSLIDDYQYQSVHKWAQMNIEEFQEWLTKELPLGTSRKHVAFFLNTNLIEHGPEDEISSPNLLWAIVPKLKSGGFFVGKAIAITFTFKDNKLVNYRCEERRTGM